MAKLWRYGEVEERLEADYGVSDVQVYHCAIDGDGMIAIRGDDCFMVSSGSYLSVFNESLYNVLCANLGLVNLENEYQEAMK